MAGKCFVTVPAPPYPSQIGQRASVGPLIKGDRHRANYTFWQIFTYSRTEPVPFYQLPSQFELVANTFV